MNYEVCPIPQSIVTKKEYPFVLNEATNIFVRAGNEKMEKIACFLSGYLYQLTGIQPAISHKAGKNNVIVLKTGFVYDNQEAYLLRVNSKRIEITGVEEAGVFYGIQTLRKAIATGLPENRETIRIPAVAIIDYPRFAYRGMMLDVGRYFFPIKFIKKYLDILALHNINHFHWHLTEDQGWRIEIKKYPKLTQIGSVRKKKFIHLPNSPGDTEPYGGYYTQEDIKDIVRYASERFITVIPEIDFPGHSLAALAAYPELGCTGGPYEVAAQRGIQDDVLCAGNEKTLEFIENVLAEIVELFPSEYIHIGGDECCKFRWEACPKCQAKIRELQLIPDGKYTAEQKLQSYCTTRIEHFLNGKGKKMVGWDEIVEGEIAPTATVMAWQGIHRGIIAAKMKHQVIMTPTSHVYFDYYQSTNTEEEPPAFLKYLPLEQVYSFEPVTETLEEAVRENIIGAQANLWTGYIPTGKDAEYMLLPRLAALSEVVWAMPQKKDYKAFLLRLLPMINYYKRLNYNCATHVLGITSSLKRKHDGTGLWIHLYTPDNSPIYYTLDGTEPTAESIKYTRRININSAVHLKAFVFRPGFEAAVFSQYIDFNKASSKPVTIETDKYIYQNIYCLTNGVKGSILFNDDNWLQFCHTELDIVIDLKQDTSVSSVKIGTLIYLDYWIFGPSGLSILLSCDKKNYKLVFQKTYPLPTENCPVKRITLDASFKEEEARYVKIRLTDVRKIPEWHKGKGAPASLLIDEIGVY